MSQPFQHGCAPPSDTSNEDSVLATIGVLSDDEGEATSLIRRADHRLFSAYPGAAALHYSPKSDRQVELVALTATSAYASSSAAGESSSGLVSARSNCFNTADLDADYQQLTAGLDAEELNCDGPQHRTVHIRLDGPSPPQARKRRFRRWLADMGVMAPLGPARNRVRTSNYTALTFLPYNLAQQFSRIANAYFLFIAFLQLIPGLSPTNALTTIAPLLFVLTVNAIKELIEDWRRHKSDEAVNSNRVTRLRQPSDLQCRWRDVCVGDVIKVYKNGEVPADMLFLSCPDPKCQGFVETASLDGETNLKLKLCCQASKGLRSAQELGSFAATWHLQCDTPNERLYEFEGALVGHNGERGALDASALLLRGSVLRNTEWAIGLVVYAGVDTKMFRNRTAAPRKVTQLEQNMNWLVGIFFVLLLLLSGACAIAGDVMLGRITPAAWYMRTDGDWPELRAGFPNVLVQFFRYAIMLNQMIPLSLYITLELVKVIQCTFLACDRQMYDAATDTPFVYRTTTLNEDLGQVEYVLTDKTGTLTQNIMGLVACSIGGKSYGLGNGHPAITAGTVKTAHALASDAALRRVLGQNLRSVLVSGGASEDAKAARAFFTHLALCNTVTPQPSADGTHLVYQASSPDEEALVEGAGLLGFRLLARSPDKVGIDVQGGTAEVAVLAVIDFSSARKRMSVVVRQAGGGIRLLCKGADSVLLARLARRQPCGEATRLHLADMARAGLRTLCIAARDLPAKEYQAWAAEWHAASSATEDREARIAAAAAAVERDLVLLGATAVEDCLQEGVPRTIALLSAAGIKVWVLTGDKLETAISTAVCCSIHHPSNQLLALRDAEFERMKRGEAAEFLGRSLLDISRATNNDCPTSRRCNVGLIVEGGALAVCLEAAHSGAFLALCIACRAVVCCRVSPMQKAQVAALVRERAGAMTLAIGDGANDVGMIQAAHIGCGISGREGRAAVLASDFSFAQFQYLSRLLLVHGRWAYKRNAEVVQYAFYKNLVYCMPEVLYGFVSGFSGQPIYSSVLYVTFNMMWACLPTIGFGIMEQDVGASTVMANPQLYQETMLEIRMSFFLTTSRWILEGLWHSLVVFFIPLFAANASHDDGAWDGMTVFGTAVYTAVVVVITVKVAFRTRHFTMLSLFLLWSGCISWFPFVAFISEHQVANQMMPEAIGIATRLYSDPRFWLAAVMMAPVVCMMLDVFIAAVQMQLRPQDYQIFQEQEAQAASKQSMPLLNGAKNIRQLPRAPSLMQNGAIMQQLPLVSQFLDAM